MKEYKILVSDDEFVNREVILDMLEDDYELKFATDGEETLQALREFNPDLLLLDVIMPKLTGLEVCNSIRKDDEYKFTKIILVSSRAMIHERLAGYEAGADDYVTKPFDEEELKAKIKVFLKLKRIEEISELKTSFMQLMSHESRTPLNAIIGMSDLLLEDETLSPDNHDMVAVIHRKGYDLLDHAEKATLLCNLMHGDINPAQNALSLEAEIETAVTRHRKNSKGVTFQMKLEPELTVMADPTLNHKVMDYLLDNSVKYSPEKAVVSLHGQLEGEKVILDIADQGRGISDHLQKRVFDLYAIHDISHHQSGLGLSLAICRSIMKKQGGAIFVNHSDRNGTCMRLSYKPGTS